MVFRVQGPADRSDIVVTIPRSIPPSLCASCHVRLCDIRKRVESQIVLPDRAEAAGINFVVRKSLSGGWIATRLRSRVVDGDENAAGITPVGEIAATLGLREIGRAACREIV